MSYMLILRQKGKSDVTGIIVDYFSIIGLKYVSMFFHFGYWFENFGFGWFRVKLCWVRDGWFRVVVCRVRFGFWTVEYFFSDSDWVSG